MVRGLTITEELKVLGEKETEKGSSRTPFARS